MTGTSPSPVPPDRDTDGVWWSDEREVELIVKTRSRSRRRGVLLLALCGVLSIWIVESLVTDSKTVADVRLAHVATRWETRFVRGRESLGSEWRLCALLAADRPLENWSSGNPRGVSVGTELAWLVCDLELPSTRERIEPWFSPEQWDEARVLDSHPAVLESFWMDEEARRALVRERGVYVHIEDVRMLELGSRPRTNAVFVPTSD